jgi:hypothetical protein
MKQKGLKYPQRETVAVCVFGDFATLCRFLGGLGDLGWKWVDIGGQGAGVGG